LGIIWEKNSIFANYEIIVLRIHTFAHPQQQPPMITVNKIYSLFSLILFYVFLSQSVLAQTLPPSEVGAFKSLKNTDERLDFIHTKFYSDSEADTLNYRAMVSALLPIIAEQKDERCLLYWHYNQWIFRTELGLLDKDALEELANFTQKAEKGGYILEATVGHFWQCNRQYNTQKISVQQFYSIILHDYDKMEEIGFDRFKLYNVSGILFAMGSFQYRIDDHEKALQYLTQAEQLIQQTYIETGSKSAKVKLDATLIFDFLECYFNDRDFSKSLDYDKKIFALNNVSPPTQRTLFWQGLSTTKIAMNYFNLGNTKQAQQYSDQAYLYCRTTPQNLTPNGSWVWAEFDALKVIIDLKLKLGQTAQAHTLLQRVDTLVKYLDFTGANYFSPLRWYQNNAKYYEVTNQTAQAYHYYKLSKTLEDSLTKRNNARELEKIKLTKKYKQEIELVENEKQFQKLLRNITFIVLVLLAVVGYLYYRRTQQKRLAEANQLQEAKEDLLRFTTVLSDKSKLVDNLQLEISSLAQKNEQSIHLEELLNSTILTEEDWRHFRNTFEKVYPNFMNEQKLNHPDITTAELRYLVLDKLGLEIHDMANMLGVARNTIIQTRLRLSKKMG
jgi:tetratricopeptide (TPR) repeat protein